MPNRPRSALAAALLIALPASAPADGPERFVEPGFSVETIASGLHEPVALAFAPDGRLFVAERYGTVRTIRDGRVSETPLATIAVHTDNENGLLGLALDPNFIDRPDIYVFATVTTQESQILRITAGAADAPGEISLVRGRLPTRGKFHSGGGLAFGPDGKLYFSIGDNLIAENGQDLTTLAGKISRINPDGSTPDDNPFRTPTGTPRAIFAYGFRNPFRFCFAPDGRLFALDVGSDDPQRREELNLVRAGGNYGWPLAEGFKHDAGPDLIDPLYAYHDGGAAPVGAVYYTGSQFPAAYRDNLFHLEYVLNRLYRVVLDGDRVASYTVFMEGGGGLLDLTQGPGGALYFCELDSGLIKRIVYGTPANPPTVVEGETAEAPQGPPIDEPGAGDPGVADFRPGYAWCGAGTMPLLTLGALLALRSRSSSATSAGRLSGRLPLAQLRAPLRRSGVVALVRLGGVPGVVQVDQRR